jgi:hypothetical protein
MRNRFMCLWHVLWTLSLELNIVSMRFIPTKVHGVLDYLVGIILIAAPWIFGFDRGGMETWIPVILGVGALVYSVMTDYEMGLTRTLSMRTWCLAYYLLYRHGSLALPIGFICLTWYWVSLRLEFR